MHATDAWLRGISVVTVADTYRPDIIYKDLVNDTIVPDNSGIVQSIQVPDRCEVRYNNGIRIFVSQQKINIGKEYNEPFEQCLNDEVHVLAAEFVKTYEDVSYRAIGLNCTISLPHNDPPCWMTQKFLKAQSPPANVSMVPRFTIKTNEAELMLAFTSGEEEHNGQRKRFVVIECNHHHNGPFKTNADILNIVTSWQDTRNTILSKIGEVLELE